jgi:hypothetical protein
MNDHSELRLEAEAADSDQQYEMPVPPSAVLALLDEIDQLKAEVAALRPDAERLRFVLKSVMPQSGESDAIFITQQDGPFGEILEGDEATKAIDLAMAARTPVYRCHVCQAVTPPPPPFWQYVRCECGALTAATAALALGEAAHEPK